ncbi:MAG: hypothetical protein IVW56_09465 [Candidatus Binataceae bacterium]|nr:hypothetical protein [Candidatus Binataceae bacterium]
MRSLGFLRGTNRWKKTRPTAQQLRAAADLFAPRKPTPERAAVDDRQCRICGCTDERTCAGGCHWVAPGLCSRCAGAAA